MGIAPRWFVTFAMLSEHSAYAYIIHSIKKRVFVYMHVCVRCVCVCVPVVTLCDRASFLYVCVSVIVYVG